MDELTRARIAARTMRTEWQATSGNISDSLPIFNLLASLDIEVAHLNDLLYPTAQGFLDTEDENLIWYRKGLAPTIERFTLAHELGHWHLHSGQAVNDAHCGAEDMGDSVFDDNLLRPEEAYSPRSRREIEANAFAAELLAPTYAVRDVYLAGAGIGTVATRFGVSQAVVRFQLTSLLLNSALGDVMPEHSVQQSAPTVLDEDQQMAVTIPTPALIVAGPGTGKTSTLVGRVHWLVEQGISPGKILALTFSRKAAQEMRERVAAILPDSVTGTPTITTFHSFCADLLRSYGIHVGLRPDFQLLDEIGAYYALRDLGPHLPLHHYASISDPTRHFGLLLSAISKAKDELADPARYATLAASMLAIAKDDAERERAERCIEIGQVYALYQAELERRRDADYGDLIRLAVRLYAEQPDIVEQIRQRYAAILVDEFQDINRANGILLRYLAGASGNIWAVGDANQAIYRFRGASPANIARFQEDYPSARIVALTQNYRSRPAIVEAANRFVTEQLPPSEGLPPVQLHATRPDMPATVTVCCLADDKQEMRWIATEIARRKWEEGTPYADQAVLCRTNAIAARVTDALHALELPIEYIADLFDDDAIKQALGICHILAGEYGGILRAIELPEHAMSRPAALRLLDIVRAQNGSLDAAADILLKANVLNSEDRAGIESLLNASTRMRSYASIEQAMIAYCYEMTDIARRALSVGGETAAHLADLLALAARYERDRLMPSLVASSQLYQLRWAAFMAFLRTIRTLRRTRPESDSAGGDRVRVMTVHAAKGLEWPIVYVPRVAKTYFPNNGGNRSIPIPDGLELEGGEESKISEEARLFYVAMTRARDRLILSRAERYGKRKLGASQFLTPITINESIAVQRMNSMDEDAEPVSDRIKNDPAYAWHEQLMTERQIQTYDDCPRQFAYRYVYHFAAEHQAYVRLHSAITRALRGATASGADAESIEREFETAWQENAPEIAEPFEEQYLRYGRAAVRAAITQISSSETTTNQISFAQMVDVAVDETLIQVRLDRVERPVASDAIGGQAYVHHIGDRRGDAKLDLRHYLRIIAQRQITGEPTRDMLLEHRLRTNEIVPIILSTTKEKELEGRVRAALAGISAGEFPARPDTDTCARCEFVLICPV
jgi:DNA helicase II / ATP-dependent DNA helicase PcrA